MSSFNSDDFQLLICTITWVSSKSSWSLKHLRSNHTPSFVGRSLGIDNWSQREVSSPLILCHYLSQWSFRLSSVSLTGQPPINVWWWMSQSTQTTWLHCSCYWNKFIVCEGGHQASGNKGILSILCCSHLLWKHISYLRINQEPYSHWKTSLWHYSWRRQN